MLLLRWLYAFPLLITILILQSVGFHYDLLMQHTINLIVLIRPTYYFSCPHPSHFSSSLSTSPAVSVLFHDLLSPLLLQLRENMW
jgi:hypothetical protein